MDDRINHEHEAQNRMVEAAGLLRWAATELRAAGRESLADDLDDESDRVRDLMSRLSWDVELPAEVPPQDQPDWCNACHGPCREEAER